MRAMIGALALVAGGSLACSSESIDDAGRGADSLVSDPLSTITAQSELTALGVDCRSLQGYTASLATATVDCLGGIRPDSFRVDEEGVLQRNFTECAVDAAQLTQIDALLSLQQREAQLPNVRQCFAGHYADFVRSFPASGVTACPRWQDKQEVNPIDARVVDRIAPELAIASELRAGADKSAVAASVLEAVELKNRYGVAFDTPTALPDGASAGAWAATCAGGFQGFVIEGAGNSILTDPPAWLLDETYSAPWLDPFLRPDYYHAMCYFGGYPGVQFGNANRYRPCPTCPPEACCYYAGLPIKTRLQLDCLDPDDWATCVSYCGPPL